MSNRLQVLRVFANARLFMVIPHAIQIMLHRIQRPGGDNAHLSHAAAEHLPDTAGALNSLFGRNDRRADRRPEALGKADRDAIELTGDLGRFYTVIGGGMPDPGAIEIEMQFVFLSQLLVFGISSMG